MWRALEHIWHPSGMLCFLSRFPVVSLAKPRSTTG
jgi:hypothetical protein